jgi:hypothetical protein
VLKTDESKAVFSSSQNGPLIVAVDAEQSDLKDTLRDTATPGSREYFERPVGVGVGRKSRRIS